jgi:hypothetical protein
MELPHISVWNRVARDERLCGLPRSEFIRHISFLALSASSRPQLQNEHKHKLMSINPAAPIPR